jgi:hypothetical protein
LRGFAALGWWVGVVVGVWVLTVFLLRRSLDSLLAVLWGCGGGGGFWSSFSSVSFVLGGLFGMLVSFPLSVGGGWEGYPLLPAVISAFRASLFFLLFALGVLGSVLLLGISSFERRRRFEASFRTEPPVVPVAHPQST